MAASQSDGTTSSGEAGVLSRHPTALAVGGGVAAAFGSSFIPMTAIEGFVTAYGIAELLPAAAPPLGNTARLALSTGIGTLTAGALLALLPRAEINDMGFETTVKTAGSAAPDAEGNSTAAGKSGKLAGWLRTLRFGKSEPTPGTVTDFSDLSRLRIRNGDQHPDAPARAPIRASSDLGDALNEAQAAAKPVPASMPLELDAAMTFAAPAQDPEPAAQEPAPLLRFGAPPIDPAPMAFEPSDAMQTTPDAAPVAAISVSAMDEALAAPRAAPAAVTAPSLEDLESVGVPALLERLEAGLARRRQLSTSTIAGSQPAPEPSTRLFALAKPLGRPGDTAVDDADREPEAQPLRFRLGQPTVEPADTVDDPADIGSEGRVLPGTGGWTEEIEYQTPAVAMSQPNAVELDAATESSAIAGTDGPEGTQDTLIEPADATPSADDDMDAALRDALATLRQLSDRQRNA
ncbi:hypothetical protein [Blastomonas sp. AAP53]|uniref:hypothetical protein n=1 Tax=Blastomonas sp. AAP53 TaxID=1248760 RepID=UPI00035EDE0B|nr:hypothetical protein [Blastomonas sp. AAP53]